jgi:hypothetical protein
VEDWPPEAGSEEDETSEELLTYEQQLIIRQVAADAKEMSREELIQALLCCWGEKFAMRREISDAVARYGVPIKICGPMLIRQPSTKAEFREALGFVPTAEEARQFLDDLEETATMELDMERIVDSVD